MNRFQVTAEEQGVLRWGGLAGFLAGITFIVVFFIVGLFVGTEPLTPAREAAIFPEIRTARIVENSLYLLVLLLGIVHFLALYRALRQTSLAPALFGTALGIVGLVMLAAGALVHVATGPIADLYHAPGATPGDRETLVVVWQATMGIFNALLVVGLVTLPLGLITLGAAMVGAPAFGKGFGGLSVTLGMVGLAAAGTQLVNVSTIGAIGIFALIVFQLVLGWKVYSLSRVPRDNRIGRRAAGFGGGQR
jgi:hypothetical protein